MLLAGALAVALCHGVSDAAAGEGWGRKRLWATIAGIEYVFPGEYLYNYDETGGRIVTVRMEAFLPDFDPVSKSEMGILFNPNFQRLIYFELAETIVATSDKEIFGRWMMHVENPEGSPFLHDLKTYRFRESSWYHKSQPGNDGIDSRQFFTHQYDDGRILMIRCDTSTPRWCLVISQLYPRMQLEYRFHKSFLHLWREIDQKVHAFVRNAEVKGARRPEPGSRR
jgi:hypothetical protein